MFRWRTTLAATASLACLAYAAASGSPQEAAIDTVTISATRGEQSTYGTTPFDIAVSGKAPKGLYPGLTRDMKLMLKNPYGFDLSVRSLEGEVIESSKRKCKPTAANLKAAAYKGKLPLIVPARKNVQAGTISLSMPMDASQACAGVTFTIRLSGTATKAYR